MSELTIDEKLNYAAMRGKEIAAEKHFFDAAQPFFPLGFSITNRNPGHWDVFSQRCPGKASAWNAAHPTGFTSDRDDIRERAFRIRGEARNVVVIDERWNPNRPTSRESLVFRSVLAAMVWICEELMQEPQP